MRADPYERRYHEAPCGLVTTTAEGLILDVNATLLSWTGHDADALRGVAFAKLLDVGSQLFFETRHGQVLHLEGRVDEVALTMTRADGSTFPVLIGSVLSHDDDGPVIRTAVFNATQRVAYERELLDARRSAESSEERVRVLQDVSGTFGHTETDQDVVDSFAQVAREAFSASEAAVMLFDDFGDLVLVAGSNPLAGVVAPVHPLRATEREIVVTAADASAEFPDLAAGLRAQRLEALSITPLSTDAGRLGLLVCFFGRARSFDDSFFDLQRALGRQASQTLVRVRLQRRLEYLALYDQLTGVPNRQFVEQTLEAAVAEAALSNKPLAVVFVDVDGFKGVNDRFGHAAGDTVLRVLAERLANGIRADDVLGRVGGDEFVAICADVDVESATIIAGRMLELAREPIDGAPVPLSVSVSIGVAVYRPQIDSRPSLDQMLMRADDAMYTAKDAGKNAVSLERALRSGA
ncbi:MAG: diguanylate cyclase [Microbacterium sp.]